MENTIILSSGEKIEVLLQDEVSLDIDCALRYIKSGETEISNYVEKSAKPNLNNVIEQAKAEMTVQIAEGIEDAKAAAETAATAKISDSIIAAEQEISSYVSQNITPDLNTAVSAAESSKNAAAGSAASASNAATQAESAATNATTAKNEAVNAASLATQKAEEAATVTEKVIPPLLSYQFADHILNNASWLRADTFSWQSGEVYLTAYEHLVDDIDGVTAETETIAGYTITFYRAADGHKICLANQESTVADIYTATGVAWYYILDTTNTRFKLPRTKFGVTGLRSNVGDYVAAGLPNITGTFECYGMENTSVISTGSLYNAGVGSGKATGAVQNNVKMGLDASRSSAVYGNSATVQPPVSQMYLYFYVGETVQNAHLIDAGQILSQLNNKADIDAGNFNVSGKSLLSGFAMPSSTYDNLTLGASGTTYTAPANGWFTLFKEASTATQIIFMQNKNNLCSTQSTRGDGGAASACLPARGGDIVQIDYNASGTTGYFRFIYAQGEV